MAELRKQVERAQLFPRPFPLSRGHAWTRVALDQPSFKWAHLDEVKLIYIKRRAQLFPRPPPPSRGHARTRVALAKVEIDARGVEAAMKAFRHAPWRRDANGMHLWGVTNAGLSWFDAGHPELEGLNVSEMSDLRGRNWARLAVASADGSGEKTFEITFPHPTFKSAARGLHNCFRVEESDRVLCAGAFLDPE